MERVINFHCSTSTWSIALSRQIFQGVPTLEVNTLTLGYVPLFFSNLVKVISKANLKQKYFPVPSKCLNRQYSAPEETHLLCKWLCKIKTLIHGCNIHHDSQHRWGICLLHIDGSYCFPLAAASLYCWHF